MEALVSAVLGDLISRSISFAVDWCCHRRRKRGGIEDAPQRLRRVLLRVQAVVEEADRRRVTNQSMLRQLQLMRQGLYRGYYLLSAFINSHGKPQGREVSQFNPVKRLKITVNMDAEAELQEVLAGLERMASDMKELVVFLSCYPPLSREPYGRHLWLENCVFGRQAEQERIISFLLEPELATSGTKHPSVLPVIGRAIVGKSTLVEHVCHDDRVRNHFSLIVFLGKSDTGDVKKILPLGDGSIVKHRDLSSSPGKSLFIIELAGDVDENTWESTLHKLRGEYEVPISKIVVTSRSEKIASFGTTPALELKTLPREAYWYYFKTIAFGSMDAEEHPELADVCMEMVDLLNRSFIGANQVGNLLRSNPCSQFWRRVLECFKEHTRMHLRLFGEHPDDLLAKDRPLYLRRLLPNVDGAPIAYRYYSKACSVQQQDVPRINADDLHTTSTKFRGKFEVLMWTSRIPPYYSYLLSCGVQASPSPLCKLPRNKQRKQQQPRLNSM